MKGTNRFKEFLPDSRNLGGKKNIESQQKNHLLALINVKPTMNTQKRPHQHVNSKHYSQKKNLQKFDEFKEVDEAFRRVNQLRKGGIDNNAPATIQRQAYIKKRIPKGKDIVMQDHSRNIKALLNRLDDVEKTHQKKVLNLKNLKYSNLNNSRIQTSQYSSANSILRKNSNNSILSRNGNIQPRRFNNFLNDDIIENQNQRFLEQNGLYEQQKDEQAEDMIAENIQNQEIYNDMYDRYESDISSQYSENQSQNQEVNQYENQNFGSNKKQQKQYQQQSNVMDHSEGQQYLHQKNDNQENQYLENADQNEHNFSIHSYSVRDYSQFTEFENNNYIGQNQNALNNRPSNNLQLNKRPVPKMAIRPQSAKSNLQNNSNRFGFQSNNNKTHQNILQPEQQSISRQINNNNKYNIPFIPKRQIGDPYRELKRAILNIVMDKNLFDKGVIKKDLALSAKKANPHLQKQIIQDVCNQICFNLFGSL
ncbi:hypothetical protein PPERSA_07080 [Pseudocohnilembus persalinus]|uniref:Uncharacterized protein n=1 Tax=Pseudocohnilembus persalinus TaxID=266149 RepID=A0A0V0QYE6_PSEPJ|nr:hypothetical protein PPERSA_07080 [Pseudocohnilembus persalinus]|eukprot:KRX06917.1 hypothetical protein PPERSA_07080 [Pseudocohnilembus persalinus]